MTNTQKYITVAELAKILKVSRVTIFNRIKKGLIPAEKIGRNFAIPYEYLAGLPQNVGVSTEDKKKEIEDAVDKVVKEYGQTLRLLGKE